MGEVSTKLCSKGVNVMKITKNFIKTVCIIYLVAIAVSCGKKEAPVVNDFYFKVQFILGDVKILKTDGEVAANVGDIINIEDAVITGSKSYIDILYGTSGIIRINENSKISIAALADNNGNSTVVNMEQGGVFATFSKLKGTNFNVKTPTVVASVRGTSFVVKSDQSGANVSVLKGTVSAAPIKDGNIIEDKAIDVQESQKTGTINEAMVDKITAGNTTLSVTAMTPAETAQILDETKTIKDNIDEIPDLADNDKEAIKKAMTIGGSAPVEKKTTTKAKPKSAPEPDNTIIDTKKIEDIKKQKEEQIKKERISNIPTM